MDFAAWLDDMAAALGGQADADVPCQGCTACCTAGQFVHIGPDEADTLAHIPPDLLFPAPRLPAGHTVLGYDEQGRCPMLVDNRCSIYEHRPRACRVYDCRVFAATGVVPDQPRIAERVAEWRFSYASDDDRAAHDRLRAAAAAIDDAASPTERALRAIKSAER